MRNSLSRSFRFGAATISSGATFLKTFSKRLKPPVSDSDTESQAPKPLKPLERTKTIYDRHRPPTPNHDRSPVNPHPGWVSRNQKKSRTNDARAKGARKAHDDEAKDVKVETEASQFEDEKYWSAQDSDGDDQFYDAKSSSPQRASPNVQSPGPRPAPPSPMPSFELPPPMLGMPGRNSPDPERSPNHGKPRSPKTNQSPNRERSESPREKRSPKGRKSESPGTKKPPVHEQSGSPRDKRSPNGRKSESPGTKHGSQTRQPSGNDRPSISPSRSPRHSRSSSPRKEASTEEGPPSPPRFPQPQERSTQGIPRKPPSRRPSYFGSEAIAAMEKRRRFMEENFGEHLTPARQETPINEIQDGRGFVNRDSYPGPKFNPTSSLNRPRAPPPSPTPATPKPASPTRSGGGPGAPTSSVTQQRLQEELCKDGKCTVTFVKSADDLPVWLRAQMAMQAAARNKG
ncbi:unnamed protein product [Bemisia tabaci]|uniref:Uncharacterized protein n=1 Tax=Bemisia tabaci TaxID=7038 RepID=A0A9P0CFP0_BEMTA|nr:unnamed protein product [Bemisia tabaci]